MTTAIDVIHGALGKLGAHSAPLNPAPPETVETALTVLQSMLAEWADDEFDTHSVVPTAKADDLAERSGAREALEYGLMFKMAAEIRKEPSLSASRQGRRALRKARERWQYKTVTQEHKKVHGQGNYRGLRYSSLS